MKKFMLVLMIALVSGISKSVAQNTLVATLSHGTSIKMFYGTNALCDAYNAAVSKDIINLSGGSFQAVDIAKAITIRGTGIDDANPTYIIKSFTINIPSSDTGRFTMEGIRCAGGIQMAGKFNNPYFVKSQFNSFYYENTTTIKNAVFANCRIVKDFALRGTSTAQFVNCYVNQFHNEEDNNTSATFINCIIKPYFEYQNNESYNSKPQYICNSQLLNCIIFYYYMENNNWQQYNSLSSSTIATNCVSINFYNLFKENAANKDNKSSEFTQVFKNFTGSYSDSQTFELTITAKKKYLGNDGTEVGLYGGILPYNSTPSYPQITKMNVANKTTADGKLSVEIEVTAAQ